MAEALPGAEAFPEAEQIIEYVQAHGGAVKRRDIARQFGVKGSDRARLRAVIKDLVADGKISNLGKHISNAPGLPRVMALVLTEKRADRKFVARPISAAETPEQDVPLILVSPSDSKRGPRLRLSAGDRVLARLEGDEGDDGADGIVYQARAFKKIGSGEQSILGVFVQDPVGPRGGWVHPVNRKDLRHVRVEDTDLGDAEDGDLVQVIRYGGRRDHTVSGRVVKTLGRVGGSKNISQIAISEHDIPNQFSGEALAEAHRAGPAPITEYEDWRALPLITIDPEDARDHDDAVHARPDTDPDNRGGWVVTVAIADVSYYVRPGSSLDRDAQKRGNSVYFADRVIPMLPEVISTDLCSLRAGEDRPALAVVMTFDAGGRKRTHHFARIMMRSAARLSYTEAQALSEGKHHAADAQLTQCISALFDAYHSLCQARQARAPLDLDLPERKLRLGKDGAVREVWVPERLDAHRLIEEFMIQANVAAAQSLEAANAALVYRVHDRPGLGKLETLRHTLSGLGLKMAATSNVETHHFNQVLMRSRTNDNANFLDQLIVRAQAKAEYSSENIGHYGLNLRKYSHFTSPIRRYADLMVHRALVAALKLGGGGEMLASDQALDDICAHISATERRAATAERETTDRLIAHYLADKLGADFKAVISGITRAGLFVELEETGADGFVPIGHIGTEYFSYDDRRQQLIGSDSGKVFRLGDRVTVCLREAAPLAGALRFDIISTGSDLVKTTERKTTIGGVRGRKTKYGRKKRQ